VKRIKNLGLAVITALALSAVLGAASASAGFAVFDAETIENVSGTVQGESTGPMKFDLAISAFALPFECWGNFGSNAELASLEASPEGISGPMTGMFLVSKECEAGVDMNSCELTFHAYSEENQELSGTFDIGGWACSGIKVTAGGAVLQCDATFVPQTGLPATYRNVEGSNGAPDWVEIEMQAKGDVEFIGEGGSSVECPKGPRTNGSWTGTWKARGLGPGKEFAKLAALEQERSLYRDGGQFKAVSYPLHVDGEQSSANELWMGAFKIGCETADLGSQLEGASAALTLVTPTYQSCVAKMSKTSLEATVDVNSCYYGVGAVLSVGCSSKEADAIVATVYESGKVRCTGTINPQSSATGLSFVNTDQGTTVNFNESVLKIKFKAEGGTLFARCGVFLETTNGRYVGSSALRGLF
jgi:hypothetical protein